MFNIQYPIFNVQCSMFNVQCSMFNVQCSMFNVQCSMFNFQCSMLYCNNYKVLFRYLEDTVKCLNQLCTQVKLNKKPKICFINDDWTWLCVNGEKKCGRNMNC